MRPHIEELSEIAIAIHRRIPTQGCRMPLENMMNSRKKQHILLKIGLKKDL